MLKLFTAWAGLIFLLGSDVFAQPLRREKILPTGPDTLTIDTLSIVPGSVRLLSAGLHVPGQDFRLDYGTARLYWIRKPATDSVLISYRSFPILFAKKYAHRTPDQITEGVIERMPEKDQANKRADNTIFSIGGLNKSGSISRSVGLGNNQDLAVNSNMTLQLAGKITEDLEITAAISDDNIPIQPEGNTQQINQFDKVFIQLKRKNSTLTGGDFEIRKPEGYFMNFYKRMQGASYETAPNTGNKWQYKTKVAAAVAKGRSARQLFNGTEGNQGPYRLRGNNGEQFIVVLSGTERVYVDGVLQTRGQENEYVIDYNTSELTFTARRLITQNSRIIVEFEYSDKNYARALTYLTQEIGSGKTQFRFNFYNEQDNANQPFLQDLRDDQKLFLSSVGNSINQAYYTNADTVPFSQNEILYKKVDTLEETGVYVHSTDPQLAKFRVGFTFVGSNQGNYRLSSSSVANGRVFEFIAPVSGLKQGDYEPVTLLITPKKQQLLSFAANFKARRTLTVASELAFSNNDPNLFSELDNQKNRGLGLRLFIEKHTSLSADTLSAKLLTSASYERSSGNFKAIERYRDVEFERDFNLSGLKANAPEHLARLTVGLLKDPSRKINYQFSTFIREGIYTGFQNALDASYTYKNFNLSYAGKMLKTSADLYSGNFNRQTADLNKKSGRLTIGLNFQQERNQTRLQNNELTPTSFSFSQYTAYLNSAADHGGLLKAEYSRRYDLLPEGNHLIRSSIADVLKGGIELNKNPNSVLALSSTYRKLKYQDEQIKDDENTFLGRLEYSANLFKGLVNSNIYYEVGPGREPKREFSYLEVVTGQGVYTWNDYNGNGLKELNEFETARFRDQARYVRVFQPTNEFITTNYTALNYALRLTPSLLFKDRSGFYRLLSRFSSQTAFKAERKIAGQEHLSAYNPFAHPAADRLISDNSFFRNTIFFNRNEPGYGIDFNYQGSGNKILLINGLDSRDKREAGLRFRCNVRKSNLIFEGRQGWKQYRSELFNERNYRIRFYDFLPEFNYQFNTNFRLSLNGSYRKQDNVMEQNDASATNLRLGSEARYTVLGKGTLTSAVSWVKNGFNGPENSPVAYEMLEGLQAGNNLVWTAGLQQTLARGIQMNLSYEGRKSPQLQTIHTGSVQFRAFF